MPLQMQQALRMRYRRGPHTQLHTVTNCSLIKKIGCPNMEQGVCRVVMTPLDAVACVNESASVHSFMSGRAPQIRRCGSQSEWWSLGI